MFWRVLTYLGLFLLLIGLAGQQYSDSQSRRSELMSSLIQRGLPTPQGANNSQLAKILSARK